MVCPGTEMTIMLTEEWEKLEIREISMIQIFLEDSMLLNVSGKYLAKKMWDKMGSLYQSKYLVNKLFLQKKLYFVRMSDGSSMIDHLNEFNTMLS
jgi:hypothetical protein